MDTVADEQLVVAVEDGNVLLVKQLLAAGVNPNVSDECSPLEVAVWDENLDIVRLLLSAGALPSIGVLREAVTRNNTDLLHELLVNIKVCAADDDEMNIIHIVPTCSGEVPLRDICYKMICVAAELGHTATIDTILGWSQGRCDCRRSRSFDPLALKNDLEQSPLYSAICEGNVTTVEYLLDNNFYRKEDYRPTYCPLAYSIRFCPATRASLDVARTLLHRIRPQGPDYVLEVMEDACGFEFIDGWSYADMKRFFLQMIEEIDPVDPTDYMWIQPSICDQILHNINGSHRSDTMEVDELCDRMYMHIQTS